MNATIDFKEAVWMPLLQSMTLFLTILFYLALFGFALICINFLISAVLRYKRSQLTSKHLYESGKLVFANLVQCIVFFIVIYVLNKMSSSSVNILDVGTNLHQAMDTTSKIWAALPYILVIGFVLGFWFLIFNVIIGGFTNEVAKKTAKILLESDENKSNYSEPK